MNPYASTTTEFEPTSYRSRLATSIVVTACVAIAVLSALDQHREGYGPSLLLAMFAASPVVPAAIIVATVRRCRASIWTVCLLAAAMVSLFGIGTHSVCAFQSTPREHFDGAGQMHIFFLPILHFIVACLIYAMLALTVVVIRTRDSRRDDG